MSCSIVRPGICVCGPHIPGIVCAKAQCSQVVLHVMCNSPIPQHNGPHMLGIMCTKA